MPTKPNPPIIMDEHNFIPKQIRDMAEKLLQMKPKDNRTADERMAEVLGLTPDEWLAEHERLHREFRDFKNQGKDNV